MLINNKSLINTINKLNLTDDEREKFNKISEDNSGNFLYNGKPVTGGATAEQAAQIQANTNAIGNESSGLIKEVNNIKNTELQNLNTAILRVNETIGDKTGLPSGDANVIASINRIDSKTSTGGTGLTSEQEAKLNSIDNKVDKIDGKGLSTNDYTTEEKTTLSNLKTAVGDTNSGLTKEVNNIKNTELQNLNTAIQTLETLVGVDETVGDKTGLPSGDANIIASINRIDSKPSGTVTDEQISTAVNNYLTEHPVTGGATTEQANQIEANRTAIGDSNGGLIKEVNDIKNTKLQNLNTAINTLETVIGDKTGLPSGDNNIIASINRIDRKTTIGNGLTSEQEAKLNSIDNKVDKINGKGLSTNDYTTEEKTTLSNLKTVVGDNNSGLVKDVKDLKENGVSQDNINSAIENYLTEHPVTGGATAEQAAQIEANRVAIGDANSGLTKEVNDLKNANGSSKNIYANNDMPTVFITSDTLTSLKSKADGTANCEFEIRFKNQIIKCFGTGKVQGNSSADYPAKNYTFKFYSDKENTTKFKIDVGWGAQNKYCFKKNWVDSTHTRNLSGARIAYDMVNSRPESDFKTNLLNTPHNGSVDGFPIKVYVNGEFWGLYTWNIPKDAWTFNMDDKNPNHMVLCAEYNNNGNNTQNNTCEFRAIWRGESDTNWSIEVGTYSEALKNSFNNAISHVMNSSDEEFKTNFSNYFDLYSILDYYCFSYLTAHIDGLGKNMLLATYDGIHWGACLYDMDSIYGADWNGQGFKNTNIKCPEEYQETNSLLWQRVVKSFSQELYDRYFELRNGALSLGNIVTHVEEIYDLIPDRVFNDDYQKWSAIPGRTENTITRFRNYMRARAVYCDDRFKELILDKSVTSVTISGKSEVKIGSSITLTANLTPSIADVKTGSWSANNTNVTLNDSNSLSVVVNGSVLGSSTITFTSDDTTNGTISATYDVNVVEASSGGTGGENQPYEAKLILQPIMGGKTWSALPTDPSSGCSAFKVSLGFTYFNLPANTATTDTSYMYCESLPVVTESEMLTNNIPCVSGATVIENGQKAEYITLKLSKSDASNLDEFKTYLTNNIISLKINMVSEVSKYTFNTDNISLTKPNFSKPGYVFGEFIDNSCPVTTKGDSIASALFMAGLPSVQDWTTTADYSYFKITDWQSNRYIGFQIAENLLETNDLDGIKKFFSKNPTLFYVV